MDRHIRRSRPLRQHSARCGIGRCHVVKWVMYRRCCCCRWRKSRCSSLVALGIGFGSALALMILTSLARHGRAPPCRRRRMSRACGSRSASAASAAGSRRRRLAHRARPGSVADSGVYHRRARRSLLLLPPCGAGSARALRRAARRAARDSRRADVVDLAPDEWRRVPDSQRIAPTSARDPASDLRRCARPCRSVGPVLATPPLRHCARGSRRPRRYVDDQ